MTYQKLLLKVQERIFSCGTQGGWRSSESPLLHLGVVFRKISFCATRREIAESLQKSFRAALFKNTVLLRSLQSDPPCGWSLKKRICRPHN